MQKFYLKYFSSITNQNVFTLKTKFFGCPELPVPSCNALYRHGRRVSPNSELRPFLGLVSGLLILSHLLLTILEVITIANCQKCRSKVSWKENCHMLTIYIVFHFALPADPVHRGGFLAVVRIGHGRQQAC